MPTTSRRDPDTSAPTGAPATGATALLAALGAHAGGFRRWWYQELLVPDEDRLVDTWADITDAVALAGHIGLADVSSWTPDVIEQVVWTYQGASHGDAESVQSGIGAFVDYLGGTGAWSGEHATYEACQRALERLAQDEAEPEDWWEEVDEHEGEDPAADAAAPLSAQTRQAMLDIDLMVARWRDRGSDRAS